MSWHSNSTFERMGAGVHAESVSHSKFQDGTIYFEWQDARGAVKALETDEDVCQICQEKGPRRHELAACRIGYHGCAKYCDMLRGCCCCWPKEELEGSDGGP